MSKSNPTALKIGMSGLIKGRRYTVIGRVVLSMVADDGETYYWNEFNVADESGSSATLVYEEAEDGAPPWKWFTLLAPRKPLTAAEAAAKRVGHTIEFEGQQIPITLVDETRVVHIEGQAPEDVEVGDVAHYFNADAGSGRMFVASWTGEDIEFYIGGPIRRREVEQAFGLPKSERVSFSSGDAESFSEGFRRWENWIVPGIILLIALFVVASNYEPAGVATEPPRLREAPASVATAGKAMKVDGRDYEVVATTRVLIGETRVRSQVRDYALRDAEGGRVSLLHGWRGDPQAWILFERAPASFLKEGSIEAAAMRPGAAVRLGGEDFIVHALFLAEVVARESGAAEEWAEGTQYGWLARSGEKWLFCRWSDNGLRVYVGKAATVR